jgi:hypothetical protein
MLRLELRKTESVYRPGEPLEGTAYWSFLSQPKKLTIQLNWFTEGKGDEDFDTALEQEWIPSEANGQLSFRLVTPRAPLSLDGTLIRICWRLEFSSEKPDEEFVLPIVISQSGQPIALRSLPKASDWFVR